METGPRHVASAWNLYKGSFSVTTQGRFYTKRDIFSGPGGLESGVTIWDSQLSASVAYGLLQHWEVGVTPVLLQKNHQTGTSLDAPGDVFVYSKFGTIGNLLSPYKYALQFNARFPTSKHHNVPLHPYSANSIGYGATGLFSINTRPKNPNLGWAFDFNLGYFNHNDQNLHLVESTTDTITIQNNTQEILGGFSARFMSESFGLFSELRASMFLQEPPEFAYTRENSAYFTQGFMYRFNPYIRIVTSVDVLLSGKTDNTIYYEGETQLVEKPWETIPNLPDWRFNIGLEFQLRRGKMPVPKPKTAKSGKAESTQTDGKPEELNIEDLERRLQAKKQRPGESSEEREARLQRERQRMEELLETLRKELKEDEQKRREQEEKERLKREQQQKQEMEAQQQENQAPGEQINAGEAPADSSTQDPGELQQTENANLDSAQTVPSQQDTVQQAEEKQQDPEKAKEEMQSEQPQPELMPTEKADQDSSQSVQPEETRSAEQQPEVKPSEETPQELEQTEKADKQEPKTEQPES